MNLAICIVCYNRIKELERLLCSIERANFSPNNSVTLIFSIDNSGNDAVKKLAENYYWRHGDKIVRHFKERQGLKKHILSCGDYTNDYDALIVLEDDIVVSNSFISYSVQAVEKYKYDDKIAGISLYNFEKNWLLWPLRFEPEKGQYDAYFMRIAQSWGQVWTKEKWTKFLSWYEKNANFEYDSQIPDVLFKWPKSSWLKYHTRYCIETDRYFVYPYVALSTNCGDAGEHSLVGNNNYQVSLQTNKLMYEFPDFNDQAIKYDEYMNRMGMAEYLGVNESELKVDLYGTNKTKDKKYLLSTEKKDFKVLRSYKLSFRPIEYSVINGICGNGIFLYDTQEKVKNELKWDSRFEMMLYETRTNSVPAMVKFTFKLIWVEIWKRIKRYIII